MLFSFQDPCLFRCNLLLLSVLWLKFSKWSIFTIDCFFFRWLLACSALLFHWSFRGIILEMVTFRFSENRLFARSAIYLPTLSVLFLELNSLVPK